MKWEDIQHGKREDIFRGVKDKSCQNVKVKHFCLLRKRVFSRIHRALDFKKAASLDISYFDSTNLYDERQNVRRDSGALSMMTNHVFDLIRVMVQLVSAFTVMITFNIWIGFGLIALYVPFALISRKHTKIAYEWTRES
jgi:hypothetical protein